jgi:hypothetical protein
MTGGPPIVRDRLRPDDHRHRGDGPVATQMREAFTVGQDDAFLEECATIRARIAEAIRAGTYGVDREARHSDRPMLRSAIGEDLPMIGVSFALRGDNGHDGGRLKATDLLPALEAPCTKHSCRRRDLFALALPAMVRAIANGDALPPTSPTWRGVVRLPTPWSPATVESDAADVEAPDFVVCGPEADPLPTECRLLVQRRTEPGRQVRRWIWTLTTQIVHFDARRMPDAIETLRILAAMEGDEESR